MKRNQGKSMRELAERRVAQYIRDHLAAEHEGHAEDIVDLVFEVLQTPDSDMLNRGRSELAHAFPQTTPVAYVRNLAGVTWRAMIESVG